MNSIYLFVILVILIFIIIFSFILKKKKNTDQNLDKILLHNTSFEDQNNIKESENTDIIVFEKFTPNIQNSFRGMEVPTDYGTVQNPSYKISGNVKGKNIVIESKGRTLWEPSYSPIWNGKWIYYGSVSSYKATLDINTVKFLIVKIDNNGKGQIEDEYLNYRMDVINTGSDILTGIIPSGEYTGFRAILKLIPSDLKYTDPSESYPVKMRYFIQKDKKRYNLSSGNIYNMEGYSTKFDGNKLILSNFLEASGIQSDPNLAFSSENLQKINVSIKEQTNPLSIIKLLNKFMTNEIKSLKLLYKASRDGWDPARFHQLCDNKGPTITIATFQDGRFIGAYSPISWGLDNRWINNTEVFLFDNDKKYTSDKTYWGSPGIYAIYQSQYYLPTFGGGHDFYISSNGSFSNNTFGFTNNGKGSLGVGGYPNYSYNTYWIKDLEVFSIIELSSMPSIIQKVSSEWMTTPIKSVKLLYNASKDGWAVSKFHELCDNKGPTISIVTLQDGRIVGGYSPISWGLNSWIDNTEVFLFDDNKKYTSSRSAYGPGRLAIFQYYSYFPAFGGGHDFYISSGSGRIENNTTLYWFENNSLTFLNNGKGPLGVSGFPNYTNNGYWIKNLEVYSVTVDSLMLKVAGRNDVPSNCERGDYKCQAKDVCEKVTGLTCLHQEYDCYYGNTGSWRPSDLPTNATAFSIAYAYDVQPSGFGNICAADRSKMTKYGLAANNLYWGLGNWTRQ